MACVRQGRKKQNTMYDMNLYAFPFPFSSRTSFVIGADVNFNHCLLDTEADSIDQLCISARSLSADLDQSDISFFIQIRFVHLFDSVCVGEFHQCEKHISLNSIDKCSGGNG